MTLTTSTSITRPQEAQYLAKNYSAASSSYHDFASVGATINNSLVFSNPATDFAAQVGLFETYFANFSQGGTPRWIANDTLFSIWFGNDLLEVASRRGYKNVTNTCEAYSDIVDSPDANDSTCDGALRQYFWKTAWNPTFPVHESLSTSIAKVSTQYPASD
ncbi:uncharacterized protein JCM6883_005393 [Sporobolomyces salmoneus]|uniref:uncharacterized protein n=1 Tax=Sporobolomyces salmoneus TaxID=183962 RepID=UPI0031799178